LGLEVIICDLGWLEKLLDCYAIKLVQPAGLALVSGFARVVEVRSV
jgi:hypothetical protein